MPQMLGTPIREEEDEEVCILGEEIAKETTIVFISKDGEKIEVGRKPALISVLVKTMLDNDEDADNLPIPNVGNEILKLVVMYMNHHEGVEPPIIATPLRYNDMKEVCNDKWDATFINTVGEDLRQLYELISAANYMDIKSLLHLGCAKIASLIKGEPLEKIKSILSVE